jgi:membrane protease YdiL (CAAX protease family)
MAENLDPVLGIVVGLLAIVSIGVWVALFDRLKRGPILRYEPRRPVPWHRAWILFPIALVALSLSTAAISDTSAEEHEHAPASNLVEQVAIGSAAQAALVAAFLVAVIVSSNATRRDIGLPSSIAELVRDVRIGVIAWLAALVPVYATQATLLAIFGPSEGHPLLRIVEERPDSAMLVLTFFSAVVAAPIGEELTFRTVLQGWLEKWDARRIEIGSGVHDVSEAVETAPVVDEGVVLVPVDDESPATAEAPAQSETPRYSWLPIVISSLLFGLAHFGYGPEPIPMFLFALILGYVYQRTHRIVPSMVAHALFNGMSLFMLWRVMLAGGP